MADLNNLRVRSAGDLLREYQTGVPSEVSASDEQPSPALTGQRPMAFRDVLKYNTPSPIGNNEDFTQQALAEGFGSSRYDTDYAPDKDLEDARAREQSGLSKIGTGALKGGVTAATTAVNTVVGTLWGAAVGAYTLADNLIEGKEDPFRTAIDAGVNNAVSNAMVAIQKKSEEWFPNYRTAEERTEKYQKEWIKHVFTPNFIGDSFLKNFGFTVGAMAGGMAWSKALSWGLRSKLAGDLLKGVTAAAAGDAEAEGALTAAIQALQAGNANRVQLDLLRKNIEGAAKGINRLGATQMLIGATIGAMGEGVTEGVMARDEFLEEFNVRTDAAYQQQYGNLANEILASRNRDWVTLVSYEMPDGSIQKRPFLTPAGIDELHRREVELTNKYQDLKDFAEQQGDRLATTTFALNIPILTLTNTLEFGHMLSGGWKTARKMTQAVNGDVGRNAVGQITSNLSGKGNTALGTALGALKVGTSEAAEEMLQGFVSSGAQKVADARLTAFNDDGYDRGVARDYADWVSTMVEGGAEYLGDWKNWQEGFMGMVTGLIGMPGPGYFSGQRGGIFEAYREASDKVQRSQELADKINKEVNSKEFQQRWHGYARHNLYERQMEAAIKKDDEYEWHTANDKQAISDIMMFADAGRLNDLYEIVDHFAEMSDQQAQAAGILDVVKTKATEKDVDNNPEKTLESVKRHSVEFKKLIEDYRNTYEALRIIAPTNISDEHLQEFVFTAMQIKRFEDRYFSLLGDVLTGIEPVIEKGIDARSDDEEKHRKLKDQLTRYADLFSKLTVPEATDPTKIADEKGIKWLESKTKGNKALSKKVKDLKKLSEARRAFYEKFENLSQITSEEFQEEAKSQEKETAQIQKESIKREVTGYDSVDAVRNAYNAIPETNEAARQKFMQDLRSVKDSNPFVANFLALNSLQNDFVAEYNKQKDRPDTDSPVGIAVNFIQNKVFENANTAANIYEDVDSLLPARATIRQQLKGVLGNAYGDTQIDDAIEAGIEIVRNVVKNLAQKNAYHGDPMNDPFAGGLRGRSDTDDGEQNGGRPDPFAGSLRKGRSVKKPTSLRNGTYRDIKGRTWQAEQVAYLYTLDEDNQPEPASEQKGVIKSVKKKGDSFEARFVPDDKPNSAILVNLGDDRVIRMQPSPIVARPVTQGVTVADEKPAVTVAGKKGSAMEMAVSVLDSGVSESASVVVDEQAELAENKPLTYYHQSIPEIDSFQAKEAREIAHDSSLTDEQKAQKIGELDLRNMDERDEKFREIWQRLANWRGQNAFDNIANSVKAGDRVKFVVDPTFPRDPDGEPNILVMLDRKGEGEDLLLTILHSDRKNGRSPGVKDLRQKVLSQYSLWTPQNDSDLFVFKDADGEPQTSRIFVKRNGFVVYGNEEKPIMNIPGRDPNAPIYFIGRNGVLSRLEGSKETDLSQLNSLVQRLYNVGGSYNPTGNLYYLAKDSRGLYSIPIRLGVEHYNATTRNYSSGTFEAINAGIHAIVEELNAGDTSTSEGLDDLRQAVADRVKSLARVLDVHRIVFHVVNDDKTGVPKLLIYRNGEATSTVSRNIKEVSDEWLSKTIAKFNPSLNIGSDTNVHQLVLEGHITSNATAMRPKGFDFYFNAWDAEAGKFKETDAQRNVLREELGQTEAPEEPVPAPKLEDLKPKEDKPEGTVERRESKQKKSADPKIEKGTDVSISQSWVDSYDLWANIPESIREDLSEMGLSEELWNSEDMTISDKKQALNCTV